jgi:hypothetical protein
MERRRCAACDRAFRPRAQVPHQRYCALAACQRERRRRWQQSKLHADADYRANQRQAQRAWADVHGEYWREYRASHPDYTDRNRLEQRRRDRGRRAARLACVDGPSDAREKMRILTGRSIAIMCPAFIDAAPWPLAQMGSAIHTQTKMRL